MVDFEEVGLPLLFRESLVAPAKTSLQDNVHESDHRFGLSLGPTGGVESSGRPTVGFT